MLFAALLAGGAWASELVESIRRVRPSIIAVGTFKPTASPQFTFRGTGFAVGDGSMVVTNAHVLPKSVDLDAYESIAIAIPGDDGPGASGRKAELLASDPEHDLALLKISGPPLVPLALASDGLVEEGELVAFTGFPIGSVLGLIPVTIVASSRRSRRSSCRAAVPGNSMPEHPLAEGSVPGSPARRHRLSGQQRQPALQAGQQRGDRAYQHGSGEGHQGVGAEPAQRHLVRDSAALHPRTDEALNRVSMVTRRKNEVPGPRQGLKGSNSTQEPAGLLAFGLPVAGLYHPPITAHKPFWRKNSRRQIT